MQLVHAQSLDQVLGESGPLSPRRAAEMARQLLSALSVAHAAGVMHRDVKPSNVLLGSDDRAVLTDFGIATFADDPKLTQTGMVMGSPGFTAPERIRGEDASPASDLSPPGSAYPGYSAAVRPRTPQPGENSMAYEPTVIKPPDPSAASIGPPAGAQAPAADTAPTTPQPSQPLPPSPGSWGPGAGLGYSSGASGAPAGSAARPEGRAPDF